MLALFLGESARPFRDGVPPLLATPWRAALATDATPETERRGLLAEAAAVVATHYGPGLPPAPALRLLQVPGAGYDGVDPDALPPSAALCNVFEHEPPVAEFALLAMLEWCHRLGDADRAVRAGDWSGSPRFGGPPHEELHGKTVAIVGLGRIGRAVAARAAAFGARALAANRTPREPSAGVEAVVGLDRLRDVLGEADFVVLACALTPETTGLIGAAEIAAMRRTGVVVNVARGPVVDEAALFRALAEERIGGAVIDTWWRYPASADAAGDEGPHPWRTLPNVLLSPHVAGWTRGTVARRCRIIAENLDRLAAGGPLLNVVRAGSPGPAQG
jgi:phosphoglycerate dehydrogenase-like enzyme